MVSYNWIPNAPRGTIFAEKLLQGYKRYDSNNMAEEETVKTLLERHVNRLLKAYCDRSSVVIRYVLESEPEPCDFVLFPNRIFERDNSVYVEGWSARKRKWIKLYLELERSAKIRVFQVDRIVDIAERQLLGFSLMGYVVNKIFRKGVATGERGFY